MKKFIYLSLILVVGALYSCSEYNTRTITYKTNEPVFMTKTEFRNSVKVKDIPVTITKKGKICLFEGYLYISEPEKGIHIINNQDPSNPQNIGFIELIGNVDLAIRNGLLFADSYIDLVWFDVSNPAKPQFKGRLNDVFKRALPIIENEYYYDWEDCYNESTENKVIIGWRLTEKTKTVKEYNGGWGHTDDDLTSLSGGNNSSNSVNGSMSRFGLYNNYLYTVIENHIDVFDVSGTEPVKLNDLYVGSNVETIFSYKENLFLGTPTGLLIYSVEMPQEPKYVSSLQHVYGCDPVVVEDDIAYVTIHSGNSCGQNSNELIVIDVSDVKQPKQIVSYAMKCPYGLGIDNKTLFVCDDGLKIFNAENPQTIIANMLKHYEGMKGFDVIPYNNILMMIAEDGLYQYDYSDLQNIRQISKIAISKK